MTPSRPTGPLPVDIDPARTALLVVDMQNDFLDERGLVGRLGRDVADRAALTERINSFISECRSREVLVVFLRVALTELAASPSYVATWGRWDAAVVEGSWGAQLSDLLLDPLPGEPVITKPGYDGFIGTGLDLVLRNQEVTTLLFAGVNTNVCVETTARHAAGLGYHVVPLADLCAAGTVAEHEAALHNIGRYFGAVARSGAVLESWR